MISFANIGNLNWMQCQNSRAKKVYLGLSAYNNFSMRRKVIVNVGNCTIAVHESHLRRIISSLKLVDIHSLLNVNMAWPKSNTAEIQEFCGAQVPVVWVLQIDPMEPLET